MEDWAQHGSTREMGEKTAKFFRTEMENTWGQKHLAVFDEEEAHNWVLGVSFQILIPNRPSMTLRVFAKTAASMIDLKHVLAFVISSLTPFLFPFQSIHLLQVSAELEGHANALRKEALQCLTIALCGSDIKQLLMAYFGANHMGDEDDPWDFIDPAPEIPCPLPLTDTELDDEASQTSAAASSSKAPPAGTPVGEGAKAKGSACHKPTLTVKKDLLDDICEPLKAIQMYPANKGTVNETGIPEDLQVSREQATTLAGSSIYLCWHTVCQEGTPFSAQSPTALYSHV